MRTKVRTALAISGETGGAWWPGGSEDFRPGGEQVPGLTAQQDQGQRETGTRQGGPCRAPCCVVKSGTLPRDQPRCWKTVWAMVHICCMQCDSTWVTGLRQNAGLHVQDSAIATTGAGPGAVETRASSSASFGWSVLFCGRLYTTAAALSTCRVAPSWQARSGSERFDKRRSLRTPDP